MHILYIYFQLCYQETLTELLDHLKRVQMKSDVNKMTTQNLAVCFGPVLLCPSTQNLSPQETEQALDFNKHIEVLRYLLDIWPEDKGKNRRDHGQLEDKMSSGNLLRRWRWLNVAATSCAQWDVCGILIFHPLTRSLTQPTNSIWSMQWYIQKSGWWYANIRHVGVVLFKYWNHDQ